MIKGIGTDIVEISRMEKSIRIPGFISTTFTKSEIDNKHGDEATYYATRFACKEAVFKAVSSFVTFDWRKVETLNKEDGSPEVSQIDEFIQNGIVKIHISVASDSGIAIAYCVVE